MDLLRLEDDEDEEVEATGYHEDDELLYLLVLVLVVNASFVGGDAHFVDFSSSLLFLVAVNGWKPIG